MSLIKNIFKKMKSEAKFKTAGQGHKLNEEKAQPKLPPPKKQAPTASRSQPAESTSRAGAAALQRFEQHQQTKDPFANRSKAAIRAEAKKELMAERVASQEAVRVAQQSDSDPEVSRHLTVSGVYFKCPLITEQVLPKEEMAECIRRFLYEQMAEEPGLTACLMVQSFNKDKDKVNLAVETLCTYLDNIMDNPTEEKFRKIRLSNRAFQNRVACLEGTAEFLLAAGFVRKQLAVDGAEPEEFYVFPEEMLGNVEQLGVLRDALVTAEPIRPELDRNVLVFLPSSAPLPKVDLPPSFFNLTTEEIKREQNQKTDEIEKLQMLRTKAMREREEQRELKKYKYTLLRIRFPDGYILQGTFSVYERLTAVLEFVRDHFRFDWLPFSLRTPTGYALDDEDSNLLSLQLVPAAVVVCAPAAEMQDELRAQCGGGPVNFLSTEAIALAQEL